MLNYIGRQDNEHTGSPSIVHIVQVIEICGFHQTDMMCSFTCETRWMCLDISVGLQFNSIWCDKFHCTSEARSACRVEIN